MKKQWLPFLKASLLVAALLIPRFSAAETAAVPEDPNKPLGTYLKNGLQVAVKRVPTSQLVSCQLWVHAGSLTEGKYLGCGISHYLEHMLFKGTAKRGVGMIAQEAEGLGGSINAYTSYDRTVFTVEVPAVHLDKALDILADASTNSVFDPAEFEKEKRVILQEFSFSEDDPDKNAVRLLWMNAFRESPARHPVIGYRSLFEKITRDDLLDYYHRNYVPNNMLLVVAGNIDPAATLKKIEALFGPLPRQPLPPVYIPDEPAQQGPRVLEKEQDVEKVYFYWSVLGPKASSPDVPALDVLAEILGGGKSSRLYQALREGKNLVYSIEAWSYTAKEFGLFAVNATLAPQNVEKLKEAIQAEIAKIQNEGVTGEEIKRAQASIAKTILTGRETASDQASNLGSNLFATDTPDFDQYYLAQVNQVTHEDVQRIANKYFTPEKESVTILRPKSIPVAEKAVAAAVPKNDIKKEKLPDGATLLVRSNATLPLVSLKVIFKGGVLSENENVSGVCHLMTQLFLKGTQSQSRGEFMQKLESLGGEIAPYTGYNSFGIQMTVLAKNWKEGLALLAEVIQKPRFDPADLENEKKVILAGIRSREDDPFDAAGKLLRETLFVQHPYRLQTSGTAESVARLQVKEVEKYYKEFVRPQNMVVAVFGDVPEKEVKPEVAKLFESFKSPRAPVFEKKKELPQNEIRKNVKMKDSQQAVVTLGYHTVNMFDPDQYPLLVIANLYSGQGSRLFKSVREEQGLAYTMGAFNTPGLDPGFFTFYAASRPEKADQVLKIILDEIELLKEKGIAPEELERAKNSLIGDREREIEKNSDFAFKVALDELYGLGWDDYKQYEKRVRAVTADDVMRAALKYFNGAAYALVEVKPKPG